MGKAVYCHLDDLTYIQSTSCEMLGWMKHKLEKKKAGRNINSTDMQMTPPLWFEQVPRVGAGQGSLACCSPWGRKESDITE